MTPEATLIAYRGRERRVAPDATRRTPGLLGALHDRVHERWHPHMLAGSGGAILLSAWTMVCQVAHSGSRRKQNVSMPPHDLTPLDRRGLQVGDRVQILANSVRAPVGAFGVIVGFTTGSHHPLVEVPGRGRLLIPALSLIKR